MAQSDDIFGDAKTVESIGVNPLPTVTHRAFGDNNAMRDAIFSNVMDAMKTSYPIENTRYRLELNNLKLDDKDRFSLADQKKAILQGKSLERRVTGDWQLFDKATGNLVDQKSGTVANIPYATDRGTFIYRGNEYTVANQLRLRPGVYTRVKDNGILEAHVNVKSGTGPSFRVYMEPQTGIFRLRVGQSTLKLYPILRAMGVQDRDIRRHWGNDLLKANIEADDPGAVSRAFTSLVNRRDLQEDLQAEQQAGKEILQLPEEGQAKAASEKRHVPTVAVDLDGTIAELYEKFEAKKIPPPRPGVKAALKEFQRLGYRIIIFTVRGDDQLIRDYCHEHEIPFDYINENPDQPEDSSGKVIADVYIDDRAIDARKAWSIIKDQTLTRLRRMEKDAKISAKESDRRWQKLWFRGTIRAELGKNGKPWVYAEVHGGLVESALASLKAQGIECERTPNAPHITVIQSDEAQKLYKEHGPIRWKGAAKAGTPVRFALQKLVSLIPHGWKDIDRVWFLEVDSPDLSKYRQDLGLTKLPRNSDRDHDQRFHITFAVHRPSTTIKRAEELFGCKRAAASVGEGFTLGSPASEHGAGLLDVFQKMELDEDTTGLTLGERYKYAGPEVLLRTSQKLFNIFNKKEEIDDRDSLSFQTLHSPEDFFAERVRKDAGQLGRKLLWRTTLRGNLKHVPSGALTPQLYSVLLKSGMGMPVEEVNPMELYDQNLRILRLGEGGIPCHSEDTDVFTSTGWKSWPEVTEDDALATEVDGALVFRRPDRLFKTPYKGTLLRGVTDRVDYLVTPNHRMYVRYMTACGGWSSFTFRTADDIHGVRVRHKIAVGPFVGGERQQTFELEPASVEETNAGSQRREPRVFAYADWVQLLGYYLADGSYTYDLDRKEYRVDIGKKRDKNPFEYELIASLLQRMNIPHHYEQERRFVITGKEFANYFRQFGKSCEKFVPEEIMRGDLFVRGLMFDAITQMDHSGKYEEGRVLYASASEKLRDQVAFLAITLGYSVTYYTRKKEFEAPSYQVLCRNALETGVVRQRHGQQYQTVDYDGNVYCADVGGGLLLTRRNGKTLWSGNSIDAVPDEARNVQPSQFGFIDPVRAPESSKIGVDSRVSEGVVRGSDGLLYTSLRNTKTGKPEMVSAVQAAASVVAFPGEMARNSPKVRAMVRSRQVQYVDRDKVDFELPRASQMFTASSNMTPMISGIKGGRLLMGAKYVIQSLPLKNPEAPLVQNLVGDGTPDSFDDKYGTRVGAIKARDRGVVTDVGKDYVQVRYADGAKENHELYQNFPFNRKSFLHNTPVVNVGDQVKPNQLLAKSNYTDDKGTVALGANLRVAYLPYKGLNYEDAIVISESAAKMMSSEHMYQHQSEGDSNTITGRGQYVSIFPSQFDKRQLNSIDSTGVAKVGAVVKYGDPLILSLNKAKSSAVHRGHQAMFSDGAVTWDHESDGVVTDVDKTKDGGYNVTVKAYMPAREGDKLAGRYGDKGVISKIIPDDQMIHDKAGNPYHILLNPLGVISRGNPSQIHEALLGKVARKRGQAYRIPGFMEDSLVDFVKKELQGAGMKDTEDVYDPATGKKIKDILTGERFIYKLHHTAESKGRGRDVGAYTSEGLPARGGEFGSKRISNMEINALLSHGATEVLRDAQVVRGQRNDDYWRAFRLGLTPPSPKVPFIYDKFLTHLKGAGINIKKDGERLQLFAMTDKDVDNLSSGALNNAKTVGGDALEELSGGLFDRGLTGGHGGTRWSHVALSEPIPNPVMEEPIRRLLNLTQNQYEQWIAGKVAYKGKYGGEAIHKALSDIDLDNSIQNNEQLIREGSKTKRDKAVKVLGYLKNMKKNNLRPEDWVMTKVPVIPPSFRPIGKYRDMPLVADANMLYQDLIHSNDVLKEIRDVVDVQSSADERLQVYNAFKAVTGLGDPIQAKTRDKKVRGLLKHVFGTSPKLGMFQRRVLGAPVDIVGRATITPNPDLGMDQVGLPEPKAWTIYRPFIMRRLVREGMPAMAAAQAVADQTPVARKALVAETQARPVLINRAPTLHRYGFMAAWPVLTKGETLQISPVVTAGFNADFDGDAMNYHVPVTDGAVSDAINKMLPSKNLKAASNFKVHYIPRQEFLMGLHLVSTANKDTPPRVFASREDVIKAYNKGDISLGDRVIVK